MDTTAFCAVWVAAIGRGWAAVQGGGREPILEVSQAWGRPMTILKNGALLQQPHGHAFFLRRAKVAEMAAVEAAVEAETAWGQTFIVVHTHPSTTRQHERTRITARHCMRFSSPSGRSPLSRSPMRGHSPMRGAHQPAAAASFPLRGPASQPSSSGGAVEGMQGEGEGGVVSARRGESGRPRRDHHHHHHMPGALHDGISGVFCAGPILVGRGHDREHQDTR
eukprot:1137821-Pelagomonas_calceolata.AAC.6